MSLCGIICNTCFYNFNKLNFNKVLKQIGNIFSFDNNIKMPVNTEFDESILMKDINEEETLNPDFDAILKSILVSRAQEGATIEEIRGDYYNFIGEKFPYFDSITERLLKIPKVVCETNENGTRIFNISSSEKSQHILDMVRNQKPQTQRNYFTNKEKSRNSYYNQNFQSQNHKINNFNKTSWRSQNRNKAALGDNNYGSEYSSNYHDNDSSCFFSDNYQYLKKFGFGSYETLYSSFSKGLSNLSNENNQYWHPDENDSAHIYDYKLMGDDFFLSMAKMELGCRYQKDNGVVQSGLCISGQTITEAINLVQTTNKINRRLIINLGSIDILQGHHLVDIQHNFICLLNTLERRGISPILTTIAPLANHGHRPNIKRIVERFNEFIRNLGLQYIDIWNSLANEYGNTLYDCYQNGARRVSGSSHPLVFWNKIGRQRVLNNIKARLEYLPIH